MVAVQTLLCIHCTLIPLFSEKAGPLHCNSYGTLTPQNQGRGSGPRRRAQLRRVSECLLGAPSSRGRKHSLLQLGLLLLGCCAGQPSPVRRPESVTSESVEVTLIASSAWVLGRGGRGFWGLSQGPSTSGPSPSS